MTLRALETMRQVHERHDLGHSLGAWPHACALCEASRLIEQAAAPDGLETALSFARSEGLRADAVYVERNSLVAALAHLFSNAAWRGLDPGAPDFTVVYIDLPTGQVSWHIPDAEMAGFPPLPLRDPTGWDGHDTDEKYRRLAALRRGDICRDVADAVQRAVNHERSLATTPSHPATSETVEPDAWELDDAEARAGGNFV